MIMVFPDRLLFWMSAVGSRKQKLSGKESDKALSCGCYHNLPFPLRALGWSAVCDCSSSWSYSLTFLTNLIYTVLENGAAKTTELSLMMSIVICMSSKKIPDYESDTEMKR